MSGNRRLDRVTDPELPGSLGTLGTDEVRTLRDEGRGEEARLSYVRRLLHGRIDIARAEVARRGGDDRALLARLPEILTSHGGQTGGPGDARSLRVYHPDEGQPRRRRDDHLPDEAALSRLPQMSDEELAGFVERLAATEREVSDQRAKVLAHLDLLQAELVARYRDGRATIDEVLSSAGEG